MDIKQFKDKLFKKAHEKGFTDCEIYFKKGSSFSINVYKGEVEKYQNNLTSGVSFRGIFNNNMGYAYSEIISEKAIDALLEGAMENAEIVNQTEKEFIYEGDNSYPKVETYNKKIDEIDISEKIESAKKMESVFLAYNKKIKSSQSCMVGNGEEEIYIANTKGLELNEKSNYIIARISGIAERDGQTKSNGEMWMGRYWEDFNPVVLGGKAAKRVLSHLKSSCFPSCKINTIFTNEAFAELLSVFVGNFYAENIHKGFSLLGDKLNKVIASPIINIADEPLLENGYATTAFDSEGVSSRNKIIVEDGVLKSFLYNLESAEKDGVKSTGNGFRASFKSPISTSATNFYIKPSKVEFNKLVEDMHNGVIITDLAGLHSGANSISGDFSLAAEGFLIESGNVREPIEQITVAGNFYDLIQNIKDIGEDLKFLPNAIGSPSVFVENIDISGI